jgi:hypothetical protein
MYKIKPFGWFSILCFHPYLLLLAQFSMIEVFIEMGPVVIRKIASLPGSGFPLYRSP